MKNKKKPYSNFCGHSVALRNFLFDFSYYSLDCGSQNFSYIAVDKYGAVLYLARSICLANLYAPYVNGYVAFRQARSYGLSARR